MILSQKYDIQSPQSILGVEVGRRRNFTIAELTLINAKHLAKYINYVPDIGGIGQLLAEAKGNIPLTRYLYLLAFWQRIQLPLARLTRGRFTLCHYPLNQTSNFVLLGKLIDLHLQSIALFHGHKLDIDNISYQETIKERLKFVALELWFAGYGIIPSMGFDVISDDVLLKAYNLAKIINPTKAYSYKLLSILLKVVPDSPVKNIPGENNTEERNIPKQQHDLWNTSILTKSQSEVVTLLCEFTFGYLLNKVNQHTIIEHYSDDGSLILRTGEKQISYSTWVNCSRVLRKLAVACIKANIDDPLAAVNVSASSPLLTLLGEQFVRDRKKVIMDWVAWLRTEKNIFITLRFPEKSFRRSERLFGRVWNAGMACTLIETLLDPSSPYYDDHAIKDFRCRRAVLLSLALAKRPHEILVLVQSCLNRSSGVYFVGFHKTKVERPNPETKKLIFTHHRVAKTDVVKWVNELLKVAPQNKILLRSDMGFGDDLEEYRLFAHPNDIDPMTVRDLYGWLARLQKKIWPHLDKPYFTPKSFRSLSLTYELLTGESQQYVMDKADHSDIKQQTPYTMTLSSDEIDRLGDIREEGVWQLNKISMEAENIVDTSSDLLYISKSSDIIPNINLADNDNCEQLSDLSRKFSSLNTTQSKLDQVKVFVQQIILDAEVKVTHIKNHQSELSEKPLTGYSRNCTADIGLCCCNNEDYCRACNSYRPDAGTQKGHKAAIFCSMVHYFRCLQEEKSYNKNERSEIKEKASILKELLEKSREATWIRGFSINANAANRLYKVLWSKAKKYAKSHASTTPIPSEIQALHYLETEEFLKIE